MAAIINVNKLGLILYGRARRAIPEDILARHRFKDWLAGGGGSDCRLTAAVFNKARHLR